MCRGCWVTGSSPARAAHHAGHSATAMRKGNADRMPLNEVPGRIFLDSSTLQTMQDYGEFVYDGGEIAHEDRIWSIPDGFQNLEALREIMLVGRRSSLQLALSRNSLQEVLDRGRYDYLQWALEVLEYWEGCLAAYEDGSQALSGRGVPLAAKLAGNRFGYLSAKDAKLIRDAVLLECDVFLTMERRLPKNAAHLERELHIKVLQPPGYWDSLRPWAALLA